MFETFLVVILSLLLGYWLGHSKQPIEDFYTKADEVLRKTKKMITPSIPTGIIKPKTAQDIIQKNRPKKEQEGLEEMKRTLDATPELAEHRKLLEKVRKDELRR